MAIEESKKNTIAGIGALFTANQFYQIACSRRTKLCERYNNLSNTYNSLAQEAIHKARQRENKIRSDLYKLTEPIQQLTRLSPDEKTKSRKLISILLEVYHEFFEKHTTKTQHAKNAADYLLKNSAENDGKAINEIGHLANKEVTLQNSSLNKQAKEWTEKASAFGKKASALKAPVVGILWKSKRVFIVLPSLKATAMTLKFMGPKWVTAAIGASTAVFFSLRALLSSSEKAQK